MDADFFYLDTSIWLDFYEKRGDNGAFALHLLLTLIAEEKKVIISDILTRELKHLGYSNDEINRLFQIIKPNHIKRVFTTKEEFLEARHLARQRNVPLGDALHAVLARNHHALFISRDKDFLSLKDIIKIKTPEEFI